MKGMLAVCRPFLSVGEVTSKGEAATMSNELGYLVTPQRHPGKAPDVVGKRI